MPFFLDGNPTQGEISEAVNYLLSNFSQSVSADPNTGQVIGPGGEIQYYLYKYMFIKYADNFDGTVGFSNTPTNKTYYGLRNSDISTPESSNPADYVWTHLDPITYPSGFGTTNFLYYLTTGGRAIQFQVASAVPNPGWVVDPGTAIDLDFVTNVTTSPSNFVVIRVPNVSTAPTNAEVLSAIGRLPVLDDMCTVNYASGSASLVYKYTGSGWAVFQKYITGDLIVAHTITANELSASYVQVGGAASDVNSGTTTINGGKITANSITVNEINNVATGQIIAGSFNIQIITSTTTFTVPAYVYKLKITLIGAGGGGGYGSFSLGTFGGFGGSGAGLIKIISVTPSQVYTVNIGAGGTGSSSGTGGTGGTSSIVLGGSTLMSCTGGAGGQSDGTPGAGGSASGGDLNYIGSYGGGAPFIGVTTKILTAGPANSGAGGGGGYPGFGNGADGGSGLCIIEY